MASGWWKSTHTNLALGSPVDFTTTTALQAPRGFPKLASIATGATHFLGGTPSVVVDDIIYYAGDDYTQNTDNPPIIRYDGRAATQVVEIPVVSVGVPAKAILSMATNDDGLIYVSTWDSGTTFADFAGRVFTLSDGVLTRIDESLFTAGKLPYSLVYFNNALYVGVTTVNPSATGEVIKLNYATTRSGGPTVTPTLTGTTYTYRVRSQNSGGLGIGKTNQVSVINHSTLDSSTYKNALTWTDPGGVAVYHVQRDAPTIGVGTFLFPIVPPAAREYTDTGAATTAGNQITSEPENFVLTVTPAPAQATTNTYRIGAIVDGIEYLGSAANVSNCPAALTSGLYVALSWTPVANATSYKVYRTAGHSTTGLISTTTATTLNDTGLAATGSVPVISASIALTSGAVGCMAAYNSNLYVGTYQPASTFGTVFKITSGDAISSSDVVAPGGTAQTANGLTAAIVFESNLYMGYWNDDATDITLIRKFDGTNWTTVSTISGAGARPIMCFAEVNGVAYAYGGGDAKTGILYSSADGSSWTNISSLLPSSLEAVPFIGTVYTIGGF